MPWLFLAFIFIPVIELVVLIEVGAVIGSFSTVALIFITAMVGVIMLRRQGLSTLMRFNQRLNAGELPADELLSAAFLVIAGAFLLTPGFITDAFGFALLISPLRRLLAKRIVERNLFRIFGDMDAAFFHADMEQASGQVYEAKRRETKQAVVLIRQGEVIEAEKKSDPESP